MLRLLRREFINVQSVMFREKKMGIFKLSRDNISI